MPKFYVQDETAEVIKRIWVKPTGFSSIIDLCQKLADGCPIIQNFGMGKDGPGWGGASHPLPYWTAQPCSMYGRPDQTTCEEPTLLTEP